MIAYRNIGGDSGIVRYEYGNDWIIVEFGQGEDRFYRYTNGTAGPRHIEQMKRLADSGTGLNSYINKYVRSRYQSKY